VEHNLDRIVLRVVLVALAPVVANGVSKYATILVERRGSDAAANVGVALEAVFCILVPEVECSIRAGCTESAVLGVERDIVDGMDIGDIVLGWISVTLEGEIEAVSQSETTPG
jgi:hypothetical protein